MEAIIDNKNLQQEIAEKAKESRLEKLREIDGLDSVDWWPLAPIWWVIIAVVLTLIIYFVISYLRKAAWRRSWKGKTHAQISEWQNNLNQDNAQEVAIKASKLARRIIMHQNSRKECAALTEGNWLSYLQNKTNGKFDWKENGIVFTQEAFAPRDSHISVDKLQKTLDEIKRWMK